MPYNAFRKHRGVSSPKPLQREKLLRGFRTRGLRASATALRHNERVTLPEGSWVTGKLQQKELETRRPEPPADFLLILPPTDQTVTQGIVSDKDLQRVGWDRSIVTKCHANMRQFCILKICCGDSAHVWNMLQCLIVPLNVLSERCCWPERTQTLAVRKAAVVLHRTFGGSALKGTERQPSQQGVP